MQSQSRRHHWGEFRVEWVEWEEIFSLPVYRGIHGDDFPGNWGEDAWCVLVTDLTGGQVYLVASYPTERDAQERIEYQKNLKEWGLAR